MPAYLPDDAAIGGHEALLWTAGSLLESQNCRSVVVDDSGATVASMGDHVWIGGGQVPVGQAGSALDSFDCNSDRYWAVAKVMHSPPS